MTSKNQVVSFLKQLKVKIGIFGVIYLDERGKNAQALLDLNITPAKRTEIIMKLGSRDYSEGPKNEEIRGLSSMWIFGKTVNKKEVYIKISPGTENSSAVCISFHIAEHPIDYPYKN